MIMKKTKWTKSPFPPFASKTTMSTKGPEYGGSSPSQEKRKWETGKRIHHILGHRAKEGGRRTYPYIMCFHTILSLPGIIEVHGMTSIVPYKSVAVPRVDGSIGKGEYVAMSLSLLNKHREAVILAHEL